MWVSGDDDYIGEGEMCKMRLEVETREYIITKFSPFHFPIKNPKVSILSLLLK